MTSGLETVPQLSEKEAELLATHAFGLHRLSPDIADDLFDFLASYRGLAELLADPERQRMTRKELGDYLDSLAVGRFDAEYIERRRHIGHVHYGAGIKQDWFLDAYRVLFSSYATHLAAYTRGNDDLYRQILNAVLKVIFFDMKLVMDTYLDADVRAQESKKLLAKSAQRIFTSTATVVGEEFLVTLARSMTAELKMQYVYLLALPGGLIGDSQIIATSSPDCPPLPPLAEWDIPEGKLAALIADSGGHHLLYPSNVQAQWPTSAFLRERKIDSLAIMLLHGSQGTPIGIIAAFDSRPMADEHRVTALLSLFAARTAMEIERIRFENNLAHQATHDALTGLPNRMLLSDRMRHELLVAERSSQAVALLFIDIDDFKNVNDCFGHDTGDQLLVRIAGALRETLREEDTVARYGGDEFVVVLGRLECAADAERVAQKLIVVISRPIEIEGQQFHCKASIGIAVYPENGDDAETLLRNADTALYRTKENYNLQYRFFTREMNAELMNRVALEDQLRLACARNEIALHYQPQIDLRSGRIVGVEALLRWQHPERGAISPGEFIPVAEACGLIVDIGKWVIERACQDLYAWRLQGHDVLRIAVNVSPRQFESDKIFETVIHCLDSHDIPHELFEIELTESLLIANPVATRDLLHAFREQGILISMDDFGTGYSSLSYLKQYPIQRLKIDQSFVRDLADDPNDAAIVQAIIAMAKALDIAVIAEGIETQVQCQRLIDWGCIEAQGFLFSRAIPAEKMAQLLATKNHVNRLDSYQI